MMTSLPTEEVNMKSVYGVASSWQAMRKVKRVTEVQFRKLQFSKKVTTVEQTFAVT